MSVHATPNNRWKVRWRDPAVLDANGKPRAKSRTFDREKDARDFDREIEVKRAKDEPLPHTDAVDSSLTFAQLAVKWSDHHTEWSKATRTLNDGIVRNHLNPQIGGMVVRRITPQTILGLRDPLEKTGASPATVAKAMKVSRTVLGHGLLMGAITSNPADVIATRGVLPTVKKDPPPRPLPPSEIEAIRTKLMNRPGTDYGLRDATFVSVMGYGGLRPGEAMGLKWSDLDGTKLTIQRSIADGEETHTKQERSLRTITLWQPLLEDLAAWRAAQDPAPDDYVFQDPHGDPWGKNYYAQWSRRQWAKYAPEGTSPRLLRASHASLRIRAGKDDVSTARYLGHSPVTLLRVYARYFDEFASEEGTIDPIALIYAAKGIEPKDVPKPTAAREELSQEDQDFLDAVRDERAWDAATKVPDRIPR
jgi:integrase